MAEYFETGSASDYNDLLNKLRNAMTTHGGWTQQDHSSTGTSGGYRSHLSKGTLKVNLRSGFNGEIPVPSANRSVRLGTWDWNSGGFAPDYIALNLSTGFNLSLDWYNQPGAPGASEGRGMGVMINGKGSVSRYWLFLLEDPDAVYLVVEVHPNKFQHLGFGKLVLAQQIEEGGEFFAATRRFSDTYNSLNDPWSGYYGAYSASPSSEVTKRMTAYFRVEDERITSPDDLDGWGKGFIDSAVPERSSTVSNSYGQPITFIPQLTGPYRMYPGSTPYKSALTESWLADESRSLMFPIACWKNYIGYSLIGHLPHLARISMEPYIAGDLVAGVGDPWLAFPGHYKSVPFSKTAYGDNANYAPNSSFNYFGTGYAIRRP